MQSADRFFVVPAADAQSARSSRTEQLPQNDQYP